MSKKEELAAFSDYDKLKAAYALNMCMVSVSQIIDYNDLYVLEQEYDAILNNLNLEQMPKDEAFLDILKQLLDTITFFRIQEGDKKMVEKEYQHKMKNAIWSGVSNIPVFAMGGSPVTTAVSIATAVGSAYMNYRKAKADAILEKEKQEWELQRSAMEQFNGLRRELFNTAWQISAQYQFPDEYRLTEKQITQYNSILMDNNYLRRYDRLNTIKDNFKAYPSFWYFFGNTAAVISNDASLSEELRSEYRKKALSHFEYYYGNNNYNLLREDQITSSCALEYVDLLDPEKDAKKINSLLQDAVKMSGNANDILQLCAVQYLKIENYPEASRLLRILVNENYNREMNAQLLSTLYVADYIKTNNKEIRISYNALLNSSGIKKEYLMPLPENESKKMSELEEEFIDNQKERIENAFFEIFDSLRAKYTAKYNRVFDALGGRLDDTYYDDFHSDKREERINANYELFNNRSKWRKYVEELSKKSISYEALDALNGYLSAVFELGFVKDKRNEILKSVYLDFNADFKDELIEIERKIYSDEFTVDDYKRLNSLPFEGLSYAGSDEKIPGLADCVYQITGEAFYAHLDSLNNMYELNGLFNSIEQFRINNGLPELLHKEDISPEEESVYTIPTAVLGEIAQGEHAKHKAFEIMRKYVEEMEEEILIDGDNSASFILSGTPEFDRYRGENKKIRLLDNDTFAIFDVDGKKDLLFTVCGIFNMSNETAVSYHDVKYLDGVIKIKGKLYETGNIDYRKFEELCQNLKLYEDSLKDVGFEFNHKLAIGKTGRTVAKIGLFTLPWMAGIAGFGVASAFDSRKLSAVYRGNTGGAQPDETVEEFEKRIGLTAPAPALPEAPKEVEEATADKNADNTAETPGGSELSQLDELNDTEMYIVQHLRKLQLNSYKTYIYPEIPYKKLYNAQKAFGLAFPNVPYEVLGIIDTTLLSSGKEGILFTRDSLYYREAFGKPFFLKYSAITSVEYKEKVTRNKNSTTTNRYIVFKVTDGTEFKYESIMNEQCTRAVVKCIKKSINKFNEPAPNPKEAEATAEDEKGFI